MGYILYYGCTSIIVTTSDALPHLISLTGDARTSIVPTTNQTTNTMADPARYFIDPYLVDKSATLYVERSPSGEWIKWADFVDYKAAQRRNKNEECITKMGIEIAELRCRIADLEGRDAK